jgi:hypothetical protein
MEPTQEFSFPTKIHFASQLDCVVGVVFADCVVTKEAEVIFYLGKVRVAVLDEETLVIGSRKIPRNSLHSEKPYFYELPEDDAK